MNRLEYKYLVPVELLPTLRKLILPYVELDYYASISGIGNYTVRTIYFDTSELKYFFDKIEGLEIRKKVRIRVYNNLNESSMLFLEIKRKKQNTIIKSRSKFNYKYLPELFTIKPDSLQIFRSLSDQENFLNLKTFYYHIKKDILHPVILIGYEREAYFHKFNKTLRITLDLNLRSSLTNKLDVIYDETKNINCLHDQFVLEIKFFGGLPVWLNNIIAHLQLKRQAVSKYTICLERNLKYKQVTSRYRLANYNVF
jgi:hypothetical protein